MTIPTSKTTTTSSEFVLLDPSLPPGLQPQARLLEKVYERYMPELSAIADSTFKSLTLKLKAEAANSVSIWVPGPKEQINDIVTVPEDARVNSYGTPVPASDVQVRPKVPVRTLPVDPRLPEFQGNPELAAVYLGRTLAKHVHSEIERLQEQTETKLRAWFGDVEVIGEIPESMSETIVNGLTLSPSIPILYARMFVHLRQV
jgi:hypothetical protein